MSTEQLNNGKGVQNVGPHIKFGSDLIFPHVISIVWSVNLLLHYENPQGSNSLTANKLSFYFPDSTVSLSWQDKSVSLIRPSAWPSYLNTSQ